MVISRPVFFVLLWESCAHLFSMTNKTPCSPPQYMQGRFWFEYYKACPGCEHRWSRCGRGHWVATGAVSLLVMPGTDPPQPASYSQPQTTSQFIGAMEIQNDGDKAAFFSWPHLNFTFTSELTSEASVNVKFKGCKLYKIYISRNTQNIDISK